MVQYASFGNFYSNYGNFQNFDFALIFIVMHHTRSYISINSRNTLDIYRMRSFGPCFSHFGYFFHSFHHIPGDPLKSIPTFKILGSNFSPKLRF